MTSAKFFLAFFFWSGLACVHLLSGQSVTDRPSVVRESSRAAIDERYSDLFEAIASKCDELGLSEPARITRGWLVTRDPARQYLFLPPSTDRLRPDPSAEENLLFWYEEFLGLRHKLAIELFDRSKELGAAGHSAEAYQLLYEVLYHDPDHENARKILGFRQQPDGQWLRSGRTVRSSLGLQRQSTIGWEKRTYWKIVSPHFEIYAAGGEEPGLELAEHLERWYWVWKQVFFEYWSSDRVMEDWFEGKGSDRTGSKRHEVILFRDRSHYLEELSSVPGIQITTGYYSDQKQASFFYDADPPPLDIWCHETVHQLFQETAGKDSPVEHNAWLVEGIAMYFESIREHPHFVSLGGFDAQRLQFARLRCKREGFFVPLEQLAPLGRNELQRDPKIGQLYSQSAGMAQFFMTENNGRYREPLIAFLKQLYRDQAAENTLVELLGESSGQLDRQYKRFLETTRSEFLEHFQYGGQPGLALGRTGLTDADLSRLSAATTLQWLELSENPIGDAGLANLLPLTNLRQLFLDLTDVTDAGMGLIKKMASLQELDLQGTRLTDHGLEQLSELASLQILHLAATQITDAGLVVLQSFPNLALVDLRQNRLSQAAIDRLRSARPDLEIVR